MERTSELIISGDRIADKAIDRLQKDMASFEKEVLENLMKFVRKFETSGGKFTPGETNIQLLSAIRKESEKWMESKTVNDSIEEFLQDFDAIGKNVAAIHAVENGITVPQKVLTKSKQYAIGATEYALKDSNVHPRFIEPVRKALYSHISLGAGVLETEKMLRVLMLGADGKKGALSQWIGQVARDAIHQYEGVVNQAVKKEFNLDAVRYLGTVVATTRPQCKRWLEKKTLLDNELPDEISWALRNGSGMIPATTAGTFTVYRGGYNCRHKAIPVRSDEKKKQIQVPPVRPEPPVPPPIVITPPPAKKPIHEFIEGLHQKKAAAKKTPTKKSATPAERDPADLFGFGNIPKDYRPGKMEGADSYAPVSSKKHPFRIPDEFWEYTPKNTVMMKLEPRGGAYFTPNTTIKVKNKDGFTELLRDENFEIVRRSAINMPTGKRWKGSKYKQAQVILHEAGHAIHHQTEVIKLGGSIHPEIQEWMKERKEGM